VYPMWTLQGQYQPLAHWEVAGVCGKGRQGAPPGESWRGLQQHWCVYSYHQSSLMQPRHGTAPSWCCWWLQLLFVCPLCGESLPDQVCHPPLSQVQVQPLAWLQHLLVFATCVPLCCCTAPCVKLRSCTWRVSGLCLAMPRIPDPPAWQQCSVGAGRGPASVHAATCMHWWWLVWFC
jgi:hypothetical protein